VIGEGEIMYQISISICMTVSRSVPQACTGLGQIVRWLLAPHLLSAQSWTWVGFVLVGLFLCSAPSWGETQRVGRVSFVAGQVEAVSATGESRRLVVGDSVNAGERVDTGVNGFAYLRMVDSAFLALRPGTSLKIFVYDFDPVRPEASRIGLTLERGSVRSVTGMGGERARDKFRLDTPLAAIGIRGTDFTVFSLDDATRVEVSRGAVIVSPLGNGCSAGVLRPCEGVLARELNASMERSFIEVNPGRIIKIHEAKLDPSKLASNPLIAASSPSSTAASQSTSKPVDRLRAGASSPANAMAQVSTESHAGLAGSEDPVQNKAHDDWQPNGPRVVAINALEDMYRETSAALRAIDFTASTQQMGGATLDVTPPASHSVKWGRWSTVVQEVRAGSSKIDEAFSSITPNFWLVGANDIFAMAYANSPLATPLPHLGALNLRLQAAEAYLHQGAVISPVAVRDGKFSVDFSSGRFVSQLGFVASGPVPAQVLLQGQFDREGRLKLDAGVGDTRLQGMLFKSGAEAAFIFDKDLAGSAKLTGATAWGK
jgi:hypothetical protein